MATPLNRVVVEQMFTSALPPSEFRPWIREVSVPGTQVEAKAVGATLKVKVDTVLSKRGIVLFDLRQHWLARNSDPLDPAGLASFQDFHNNYGRYQFNLFLAGSNPYNIGGSIYDPSAAVTRKVTGFIQLNENLLGTPGSAHATAIYIPAGSSIEVGWTKYASPGIAVDVVKAHLFGYDVPDQVYQDILSQKNF